VKNNKISLVQDKNMKIMKVLYLITIIIFSIALLSDVNAAEIKSPNNKHAYKAEKADEDAAILNSLIGNWIGRPGRSWAWILIFSEEDGELYLTYETTHIMNTSRESFNWDKVRVTRKGKNISFNVKFRYYNPSSKKYVGEIIYADYNLELIDSGILKGKRGGIDEAYFIKDKDKSLWQMDDESLRKLIYNKQ